MQAGFKRRNGSFRVNTQQQSLSVGARTPSLVMWQSCCIRCERGLTIKIRTLEVCMHPLFTSARLEMNECSIRVIFSWISSDKHMQHKEDGVGYSTFKNPTGEGDSIQEELPLLDSRLPGRTWTILGLSWPCHDIIILWSTVSKTAV